MNSGIHTNIPATEYHSWPGISPSRAKPALESALAYKESLLEVREETDAMRLGTLVHAAIMEPATMMSKFAVWEGGRRAGNEWKAFQLENESKTIVTKDQVNIADRLRLRAWKHQAVAKVMHQVEQVELSMVWEQYGAGCKGRPDMVGTEYLADVKTTANLSESARCRTILNFSYDMQLAAYLDGYKACTGIELMPVIIWCVTKPPYDIVVCETDPLWIERGRKLWKKAIETIETAKATNTYHGISDDLGADLMPAWVNGPGAELELTLDGDAIGM